MACNDCFNGCVQTTSDQCVKYTGNDITALGISKGDPLSDVILHIKTYLETIVSGDAIIPQIATPCAAISDLFPPGADVTLNTILDAIADIVCDLQAAINIINGYTFTDVDCLTDVQPYPTEFLDVIQAIIDKICAINADIGTLQSDVSALQNGLSQYVTIVNVGTYVATYLNSLPEAGKYYTRMVPYVAEKYYGPRSSFSLSGAGSGAFQYIYVCNGNVGTPDLEAEFTTDYIYIMHIPPGGLPE